jgi:hypothetical protein
MFAFRTADAGLAKNGDDETQRVERTRYALDKMFITILFLLLPFPCWIIIVTIPTIDYARATRCADDHLFPLPFIQNSIRTGERG